MKQGLDLVALAEKITAQAKAKKDIVASTENMAVAVVDQKPRLRIGNGDGFDLDINTVAHKQLTQHTGIPAVYYDKMLREEPELLATNVNRWLHKDPKPRLVRTLDGTARAFLSDSYRPLENEDLAEAVLPVLLDIGVEIVSTQITEQRLYIKAVDAKIRKDIPSGRRLGDGSHVFFDTVSPAIVISNSEVGMGALSVETGIWTKVCTNLAVVEKAVRKTHLGARHQLASENLYTLLSDQTRRLTDAALWAQIRDVVKGSFEEAQFAALTDKVAGLAEQKIEGDPVKVVDLSAKKWSLNDNEKGSILRHLIEGGDLTRYGLFNAITRTAEDLENYDRASEFEKLGGKVIELPRNQWEELAKAA